MTPPVRRGALLVSAVITVAIWTWALFAPALLPVAALIVGAWVVLRKNVSKQLFAVVLISSPLVTVPVSCMAQVAREYLHGTASVPNVARGYPSFESRNLDRHFRAFPSGAPCDVGIGPAVVARIKLSAFTFLFWVLGPMPEAYTGAYPNREEALAIARNPGTTLSISDWEQAQLPLRSGRITNLERGTWERAGGSRVLEVSVAEVADLALIHTRTEHYSHVTLVDLGGFGWFATYRYPLSST